MKAKKGKKGKPERQCIVCHANFIPIGTLDNMCRKCVNTLPRCAGCGIVCGGERYNYLSEANVYKTNDGREITLCDDCFMTMNTRGYLNFNDKRLMPDGLLEERRITQ